MKVLMTIKKLRYSGAYKMFMWVAQKLANQGFDVTVYTYMKSDVKSLGDKIHWIEEDLERSNFLSQLKALRKIVKKVNADCCISFLLDANLLNTLACIGTKTKSIICERNDPFKPKYYKLLFTKWIFRWADGAVFQLPKVKEYYNMIKGATAIIPNPVPKSNNDNEIEPFEKRNNKIITLGRLDVAQKRHDILIKAFVDFHKKHQEYELEIYGDGHIGDVKFIENLIKELNANSFVHLKGITDTPKKVLSESKFFVLSSDFEGIPNALIEAMTIGLPCISTDCRPGGAAILIKNNRNAIIVPPHNIEKLLEAMLYIANHPIEADEMGKQAKFISQEFSEDIIIHKWIAYLNNFKSKS